MKSERRYIWSSTLKRKLRINVGRVNESRKAKERKQIRESGMGVGEVEQKRWNIMYKKWMTIERESENHTVVAY